MPRQPRGGLWHSNDTVSGLEIAISVSGSSLRMKLIIGLCISVPTRPQYCSIATRAHSAARGCGADVSRTPGCGAAGRAGCVLADSCAADAPQASGIPRDKARHAARIRDAVPVRMIRIPTVRHGIGRTRRRRSSRSFSSNSSLASRPPSRSLPPLGPPRTRTAVTTAPRRARAQRQRPVGAACSCSYGTLCRMGWS